MSNTVEDSAFAQGFWELKPGEFLAFNSTVEIDDWAVMYSEPDVAEATLKELLFRGRISAGVSTALSNAWLQRRFDARAAVRATEDRELQVRGVVATEAQAAEAARANRKANFALAISLLAIVVTVAIFLHDAMK